MRTPALPYLLGAAASVLLVAGLVCWRLDRAKSPESAPHAAVVFDRSASASAADSCGEAGGLVQRAFDLLAAKKGSLLLFSVTGSAETANEPVELLRAGLPRARTVLEGRGAVLVERARLLGEVLTRCRAAETTRRSPIILAVRRSLETLHGLGCRESATCLLLVKTDGDETEDRALLMGGAGRRSHVDNDGVRVTLCGFANVASSQGHKRRHHAASAGELEDAWLGLFTHRGLVTVEPHCPVAAEVVTASRGGH